MRRRGSWRGSPARRGGAFRRVLGVLAVLGVPLPLLLPSAASSQEPVPAAGPGTAADAMQLELLEADRAFARATAERGIDGWLEWFAPEGAMIRGTGEIVGHADIREAMEGLLSDPAVSFTWAPIRAEISGDGRLGYTVGEYRIVGAGEPEGGGEPEGAGEPEGGGKPEGGDQPEGGGEPRVLATGMYLTVWRKGPDGAWRVVADIGSPAGG